MRDLVPPGRPALDPTQPSTSVSVTLPIGQFEGYCVRAAHDGVSVPEIIRADLAIAADVHRATVALGHRITNNDEPHTRRDTDG